MRHPTTSTREARQKAAARSPKEGGLGATHNFRRAKTLGLLTILGVNRAGSLLLKLPLTIYCTRESIKEPSRPSAADQDEAPEPRHLTFQSNIGKTATKPQVLGLRPTNPQDKEQEKRAKRNDSFPHRTASNSIVVEPRYKFGSRNQISTKSQISQAGNGIETGNRPGFPRRMSPLTLGAHSSDPRNSNSNSRSLFVGFFRTVEYRIGQARGKSTAVVGGGRKLSSSRQGRSCNFV